MHPTTRKTSVALNDILNTYIAIHDDIFRFSIRRWLPIPWFFYRIPFEQHLVSLTKLLAYLNEAAAENDILSGHVVGAEREYITTQRLYITSLARTVERLAVISGKLAAKGEGSPYKWSNYKKDLADYDNSVEGYLQYGQTLTDQWRRLSLI